MSSKPLIVICGTTGVGKSKLGIELALALSAKGQNSYHGARIINADSMQVYVGMDVITNKVPVGERCGVEHLLMDYKKPGEQLTGPEWIRDAIEAVSTSKSVIMLVFMESGVDRSKRLTLGIKFLSWLGAHHIGFNTSFSPSGWLPWTSHQKECLKRSGPHCHLKLSPMLSHLFHPSCSVCSTTSLSKPLQRT